jgi:hypothetical protein
VVGGALLIERDSCLSGLSKLAWTRTRKDSLKRFEPTTTSGLPELATCGFRVDVDR